VANPKQKEEGDLSAIAFLLSLNLRDYPMHRSGFIPFGVQPLGLGSE
jgi:hypothetical protein